MTKDSIAEVGIDELKRLYARPTAARFPNIYREAVDIHWEPNRHYLYATEPRNWSYLECFQHIVRAAALQGFDLRLAYSTLWTNIPAELIAQFVHWSNTRGPM